MNEYEQSGRIGYLDGIKTFALFLVFALHTQRGSLVTDQSNNPLLFYAARCCMPLIFMVNGALILRKDSFSFSYYLRKIFEIIRALMISGILVGIYVGLVYHFSVFETLKEIIKGFLSYTPYAFLWFFYTFAVIYTILLFIFPWLKKRIVLAVGILAICCIGWSLASLYSISKGGFFVQAIITQRFRIWTWLFYFCLGYYLSIQDVQKWNANTIRLMTCLMTAVCVIWQYWLCLCVTGQIESNYMYDDLIIMIWSALIFVSFMLSPKMSSIMSRFAKYSYGAFLVHGFIIDFFQLRSEVTGVLESTMIWVILVAGSWILSWLLNRIPVIGRLFNY